MSFSNRHFHAIQKQILSGHTTCEKITETYLEQIRQKSHLNAFITVFEERALSRARSVDKKVAEEKAGKLAGLVMAVKDIIVMKDIKTTCGSKMLENFYSPFNATVIQYLEAEDAIIIGKTNMDEFGMGSSTENSAFGPVKNPHDDSRIPGGSSGGSAAAVAANCAMAALGSDTGGSVRQPASHCGVVGLRPTYGRISRYGLVAFASSLDQIGIFSNDAEDCSIILEVIAGQDYRDATSSSQSVPVYSKKLEGDLKGLRIGLPEEYFQTGLQPEIDSQIHKVVDLMVKHGCRVHEISLSMTDYGISAYYLICTAEASSNLARYDGIRYGLRKDPKMNLEAMFCMTRSQGFGPEVKRRIMLGTYVLSAGYYDAFYRKAQKIRTLICRDYKEAFKVCDIIIGPTTPTTAFRLGEKSNDPMEMYLSDIYTVSAPLAGIPAISVPIGYDNQKLPIGMQITAPAFKEDILLKTAYWLKNNIKFTNQSPD